MSDQSSLPVSKKSIRQCTSVQELLVNEQAMGQLGKVAAKHMNPERMMRVMANAVRTTPKLAACDPLSMLGALMNCAALGLEPNTPLGHAYLIPFENKKKKIVEVQMIVGYKGFIDLARRSGQLANIHVDMVYDDDEHFSHEYGSDQHLRHRPGPRKGKRLGAYCYVRLSLSGGMTAEGHRYMSMAEIISHRDKFSKGWQTAVRFGSTKESLWHEDHPAFEAMAQKTAVRQMASRGELPLSIEFMTALEQDEAPMDFGRYALDPSLGADIIDGKLVDDDSAPQTDTKSEPKKAAVTVEANTTDKWKAELKQDTAKPIDSAQSHGSTNPALDTSPSKAQKAVYDMVLGDALEAGGSASFKAHVDAIVLMERAEPALHTALMDELRGLGLEDAE